MRTKQLFLILTTVLYTAGLYFFYIRYVPLVTGFQLIFLPLLTAVAFLSIYRLQTGILVLIFFFPLINNLPYFFGIYENIPHAPTALVLFLFFFWGVLVRTIFFDETISVSNKVTRPLVFLAALVFLSGIITFFRYSNYFPFLSGSIYEWTVNRFGVTAGGALMSVALTTLNYLTGFAFLFILLKEMRSERFRMKALSVLCVSITISLGFALFQQFSGIDLGNSAISRNQGLISGTFKDSLSLGAVLSMMTVVLIALALGQRRGIRRWFLFPAGLSFIVILATGSKGGLISLLISHLIFFRLVVRSGQRIGGRRLTVRFPLRVVVSASLILSVILISALFYFNKSVIQSRTLSRLQELMGRQGIETMVEWRGPLWETAGRMIMDYPLTGVGTGAYIIELPNYHSEFRSREVPQSAENYFLQIAAELGLSGLALMAWFIVLLLTTLKQRLRDTSLSEQNRLLLFGLTGALAAFFINSLFHTFIGSFEVKYTLWLLVAAVLTSGSSEKRSEAPNGSYRILRRFGFILILVVSGLHLLHSTRSLSPGRRTVELGIQQTFGLHAEESDGSGKIFRWTEKTACLTVDMPKNVLILPFRAAHPNVSNRPVPIKIYMFQNFSREMQLLDEFVLINSRWVWKLYDLAEYRGKRIGIFIEVGRTWSPHEAHGTSDRRQLGVALGNPWWRSHFE